MVAGEAVTDSEVLVEDTILSVAVTNLADSPTAASFRDSGGRVDFLLVASVVAEITAALLTMVSVDAVATFAILLEILSRWPPRAEFRAVPNVVIGIATP